ncbi:hypothetical protein [Streptomyces sp. NPDC001843]|uniref:hypothetical protein n=1 Tax=Streptomyces sp. NPDC001843 TaxID=3364617 RepID=UPI00368C5C35
MSHSGRSTCRPVGVDVLRVTTVREDREDDERRVAARRRPPPNSPHRKEVSGAQDR